MPVKNYKDPEEYAIDIISKDDSVIPVIIYTQEIQYNLSKHFLNNSQIDQINEYIGKKFLNDNFEQNISSTSFGMAIISLLATILINIAFLYSNNFILSEKTYNIILKTN